jgi:hypothetical protein
MKRDKEITLNLERKKGVNMKRGELEDEMEKVRGQMN